MARIVLHILRFAHMTIVSAADLRAEELWATCATACRQSLGHVFEFAMWPGWTDPQSAQLWILLSFCPSSRLDSLVYCLQLGCLLWDKRPELPPSRQFIGTHSISALHRNTTKYWANGPPETSAQTQILICLRGTRHVFVSHRPTSRLTHTSTHVHKDK